jgi:hypothetical protein
MSSPLILPTQKNELFELLRTNNLPVNQFGWETPEGHFGVSIPRLAHSPSGLYFEILFSGGFLKSVTYFPGSNGRKGYVQVGDWNGVMRNAELWAAFLKREVSVPDLWASIQTEREFMSGGPITTANSAFGQNEKERISRSLNEIRGFLENTQKLSEGQLAIVSSRLAHLEDAANRVGRKDWLAIAYGTLVNIAVTAALTTEQAQAFIHFAASSLSWMMTMVKALT